MKKSGSFLGALFFLSMNNAIADGLSVGKVYDPYVQPLEKELEFHTQYLVDSDDALDGAYRYKLGYGQSLNDCWFAEFYILGEGESGEGSKLEGYEAELKYQLTEQGEFSADWGLLFEVEREREDDVWESSVTLISQKDLSRFSLVGNLSMVYESSNSGKDEWEMEFAGQARYRLRPSFEPGVELFMGENTLAVGPSLSGVFRTTGVQKLLWQLAMLAGVDSDTPDLDIKLNLEYEF